MGSRSKRERRRAPRSAGSRGRVCAARRGALVLLGGVLLALGARSIGAQPPRTPSRWLVRESATLDLWYHALATIGYEGFGPLPYHAPGYAAELRRVKAARGVTPTPLEHDAAALRAAFASDSAFEVLHFVPLYFASTDPASFVALVGAVGSGRPTGTLPPAERAGVDVLRTLLASGTERAALVRLARDLDVEWREFYAGQLARTATARAEGIAALQRGWDERVLPSLGHAFHAAGLTGGAIYLVPALGPEGRVITSPSDAGAAVAVEWPLDDAASDVPLLAAVRELCFPVVRRLPIDAVARGDRIAAERESDRAAVRCGAQLLDATAPALARAYRETFRRAARTTAAGTRPGFTEVYRLAPATERALDAEVRRLLATPTGARP